MSSAGTPSRIGAYEIAGELGRGGMGVVYRAVGPDRREVAIKLLLQQSRGEDSQGAIRFERERRLLASLGEGFVPLLDAGVAPTGAFIVMPFVTGGTLRQRLKRGPLPVEEARALGISLAETMGRAHALGIVHRDLKPENVLFTADGKPLVADLGLAKHFSRDAPGASQSVALSKTGVMAGTAGYMAPEQMDDAKSVGPAADVFALGAILYECLAGRKAFEADSIHGMLARVATANLVPLRELRPEVPRPLAGQIARALANDPAARFPDGAALARALAGETTAPTSRTPKVVAALGALGAVALLAAGWAVLRRDREPPPTTPVPAPVASTTATVAPAREETPSWFRALPVDRRPSPLPRGVRFGDRPGEYVNEIDESVLVYVMPKKKGPPFFVGKHEVTHAHFAKFVQATGYVTQAEKTGGGLLQKSANEPSVGGSLSPEIDWRRPFGPATVADLSEHPVVQVTLEDAQAYCDWAKVALPTDAEWMEAEYPLLEDRKNWRGSERFVARRIGNLADETLRKARGDGWKIYPGYDDGFERTAPVGRFPDGASEAGALDMIGNVSELVIDPGARVEKPSELTFAGGCAARGGSYLSPWGELNSPDLLNSYGNPIYRSDDMGFRIVKRRERR
jgi:serine/threonine protein kinase/formylglycine-generating enzyme required for sulfatase activity